MAEYVLVDDEVGSVAEADFWASVFRLFWGYGDQVMVSKRWG